MVRLNALGYSIVYIIGLIIIGGVVIYTVSYVYINNPINTTIINNTCPIVKNITCPECIDKECPVKICPIVTNKEIVEQVNNSYIQSLIRRIKRAERLSAQYEYENSSTICTEVRDNLTNCELLLNKTRGILIWSVKYVERGWLERR